MVQGWVEALAIGRAAFLADDGPMVGIGCGSGFTTPGKYP
jgi:hypothetical protein